MEWPRSPVARCGYYIGDFLNGEGKRMVELCWTPKPCKVHEYGLWLEWRQL